jgi:hypothetical protein
LPAAGYSLFLVASGSLLRAMTSECIRRRRLWHSGNKAALLLSLSSSRFWAATAPSFRGNLRLNLSQSKVAESATGSRTTTTSVCKVVKSRENHVLTKRRQRSICSQEANPAAAPAHHSKQNPAIRKNQTFSFCLSCSIIVRSQFCQNPLLQLFLVRSLSCILIWSYR